MVCFARLRERGIRFLVWLDIEQIIEFHDKMYYAATLTKQQHEYITVN